MRVNIQHFGGRGGSGGIATATHINVNGHELFFGQQAQENIKNREKGKAAIEQAKAESRFNFTDKDYKITPEGAPKVFTEVKKQYPDSIVFTQVAEFYETFGNDAKTTGDALDLVVTGRAVAGGDRLPITGMPISKSDDYFDRLAKKTGKKIIVINRGQQPKEYKSK